MNIELTQGKVAVIDEADASVISQRKWFACKLGNRFYAMRNVRRPDGSWTTQLMHRALIECPTGFQVDHISGDTLDNRRSNLRIATVSQNQCNRGRQSNNKSGYKGVSWNRRDEVWQARICHLGKQINLGAFDNPQAAHLAYIEAGERLHADFAGH